MEKSIETRLFELLLGCGPPCAYHKLSKENTSKIYKQFTIQDLLLKEKINND